MSLILVGLNHRTAPVGIRERLSVSGRDADAFLKSLLDGGAVRGAALLSTCNRVEIIASTENEDTVEALVEAMMSRTDSNRAEIEKHLYILRNADVVRQLFRVAAGLDSMILGEPQIGGQVRESYLRARQVGTLDPLLTRLYEQTLRAAKRIRTETGIGENAVSVPYAAVEMARKIFGDLRGLKILLIGAGKIGELTAQHLQGLGLEKVFVANRARERATDLARRFGGHVVPYEELENQLESCDIVISSTAAPHYVLRAEHVQRALAGRRRRELFLIDLSVPRNLDPAIAALDGAYLYNIDDLEEVADGNRLKRERKAEVAEAIVDQEVSSFLRRLSVDEAVPTIVDLQHRLEEIRQAELEKCMRRLGPITTEQRAAIDALTSGIINKILHYPIVRLRESVTDREPESIRETIRKIFGLR